MRLLRLSILIAGSIIYLGASAANVQWNWARCERFIGSSWVVGYSNDGDPVVYDASMMLHVSSGGSSASVSSGAFGDLATATWLLVSAGDIINDVLFESSSQVFFSQREGAVVGNGSASVQKDSPFYLAVKAEGFDWDTLFADDAYVLTGDARYGWVELAVDASGDLKVMSSAWDLDGGAMYVGGGAVPEPSSVLLMLLGLTGLSLRRKKGS